MATSPAPSEALSDSHPDTHPSPASDTNGASPIQKTSERIKLVVGPEKHVFHISKDLICNNVEFFSHAFTGNFMESKTKTLNFPDDDPDRFVELETWLRGGKTLTPEQPWITLAKSYLFAEKYHIDELQNKIVDALYAKYAAHEDGINISFETLDFIMENSFAHSPLRRLFADMLTNGISLQQLPSRLENIPTEFIQDMCLALKSTVHMNGPTNISLLTHPISTYYASSAHTKATAMPRTVDPADVPTQMYCDGFYCTQSEQPKPIQGLVHICTNHNIKLCDDCRGTHHGHRKKMMTLTTAPYRDALTGSSTIIDCRVNDSGFYCDGPKCDPGQEQTNLHQQWALLSCDRYHCLDCKNTDFCSVCIRGPLPCKNEGHSMLRIRPTFARKMPLTEQITIKQKQDRVARGACWRCGSEEHATINCTTKEPVLAADVDAED
ncbi:hypothetical protein LTR37_000482 [Vermiconidia calcicola]|uniref:Uncharacterized protein n=1 Tax=Vermiconidia calcicola TaxID=1690605 RepID=A0ACC3NYF3_9PEZI|nr:hypothetical protein LTR37_000482 [Vermiconidia calcicola]